MAAPYAGIYGQYHIDRSPWNNISLQKFRKKFYFTLNQFLLNQKTTNRITKAFIWNADSWDVLGVYPNTENYRDPDVYSLVFD